MNLVYESMSDESIIERIHGGDNEAVDYLIGKYVPLVKRVSRTMYIIGSDFEDITQEGMIGLFKAIRDYSIDKGSTFYNFAKLCIERQVYSAVTASNRKKHTPLNTYISLYADHNEHSENRGTLADVLEAGKESNPEATIIGKEELDILRYNIDNRLSGYEKKVLDLYLDGMSYADIGERLDKTAKSIDNAVQRIRNKLSE